MALPPSKKVGAAALIATALAMPMEGLRQVVYKDPVGIPTVCFGTTGKDVIQGKFYSVPECKALLNERMLQAATEVDNCAPDAPPMVLAAFSDAAYNIGSKIACDSKRSGAARALKKKDWVRACQELLKWDKATYHGVTMSLPGLTKRREAEYQICMKGFS